MRLQRGESAKPCNDWNICLLYNIHIFQPDRKIEGHYSDSVSRELHSLFERGKNGAAVIRVTFNDWRNSIRVLCFASSAWILFIQPFQLECGNSGYCTLITHPAECVAWSEKWMVMSQRGGELSDRDTRDIVYSCLFPVCKWKNLHLGFSQDLGFVECPHLTLLT